MKMNTQVLSRFILSWIIVCSICVGVVGGACADPVEMGNGESGEVVAVPAPVSSNGFIDNWLERTVPSPTQRLFYVQLFHTGLVLILGYLLMLFFVTLVNNGVTNVKQKHLLRKNVTYFFNILIGLFVVFIWIQRLNSLTMFLSFIGAGIALALQEVVLCLAGWLTILIRQPFRVSERIEFGGVRGDVIDIRMFQTTLLEIGNWVEADQSTGRIVNIPNSAIFKKENYNYSRGFDYIWNEIKVVLTFESDWKKAEGVILKRANELSDINEELVKRKIKRMSREYMIFYEKLSPIVYVDIKDSGVQLTLRYLTDAKKRRYTQTALSRAILDDVEATEGVEFAYNTFRVVK